MEYNHIKQVEYEVVNMLKHGILGLLNYGDMTGYEIMKVFRDSLNFFWAAKTSQIYRELQTLKKEGFVTDVLVKQTGKSDKKVFSITESGKKELKRWLREYNYGNTNNALCMKVFFSGELSKEENIERFENIKKEAQEAITRYSAIFELTKAYSKMLVNPEKAAYWDMTVDYGIRYMKMLVEWCDACIRELGDVKE